jgi:uncharacterized protein YbcI
LGSYRSFFPVRGFFPRGMRDRGDWHGQLTKAEKSLATDGKKDLVLGMRHAFQETMQSELTGIVEELTGRRVVAFMSANHVDPDLAAEVFVLDQPIAEAVKVDGYKTLETA